MNWTPDPIPTMDQVEYDLLRAYMIEHNGWGQLPALVVDDEHILIDGFKRHQVYTDLADERGWPRTAPVYILYMKDRYTDAQRSYLYVKLRRSLNARFVLIDEIEDWLRNERKEPPTQ